MKMTVLSKYGDKAIIYRENEIMPFVVAELENKRLGVGDICESYKGGTNYYFRDIESAVLKLHNIELNFDSVEIVAWNANLKDYGIFECAVCGRTFDISDMCSKHNDEKDNICTYCCEKCTDDRHLSDWEDLFYER